MTQPILSLLVIRSADVGALIKFYELFGLSFKMEQHDNGPIHHSARLGDMVFEIYRSKEPDKITLGFAVDDLNSLIIKLRNTSVEIFSYAESSPFGYRSIVRDPDSRMVFLYQREPV